MTRTNKILLLILALFSIVLIWMGMTLISKGKTGIGTQPTESGEIIFDGSRAMLDDKWTYWKGPRFSSELPVKWKIVKDPVGSGTVLSSNDPYALGGNYGTADIVTKKKYRDFKLHIEFLVADKGGNSGIFLQNRYEIQVLDGDTTKHGMGAIINEVAAPPGIYNGIGKWNAYDIIYRAARFNNKDLAEKPLVTVYFNGKKIHSNVEISQVWGGANAGLDGGNKGGKGITDTPGGLKLQAEGHDVLFRNIWIEELNIVEADTDI